MADGPNRERGMDVPPSLSQVHKSTYLGSQLCSRSAKSRALASPRQYFRQTEKPGAISERESPTMPLA